MARRAQPASQGMRLVLVALALAGLTLGVMVATHGSHSAEGAIERRERQKLKHFARLERAGRAKVAIDRTLHEYAEKQAKRGHRLT